MDTLLQYIQSITFSEETLVLLMVLLSTITIVVAMFLVVTGSQTALRRRLDTLAPEGIRSSKKEALHSKVGSLSPLLTPKNAKEREDVRVRLIQAGFHHESAISYFYAIKIFATFCGLMVSAIYYLFSGSNTSLLMVVAIGAGVGMFVPNIVLNHLVKKDSLELSVAFRMH